MGWNCCVRTRTLYRTTIKMPKMVEKKFSYRNTEIHTYTFIHLTITKKNMMKKKANGGIKENLAERPRTRGFRVNKNAAERILIMDDEHFRCRKPIAHTFHLHVQCIFSWHLSMWLYTNSCTSHYSRSLSITLSRKFFSSIFLNVSRKSNMQNNIS